MKPSKYREQFIDMLPRLTVGQRYEIELEESENRKSVVTQLGKAAKELGLNIRVERINVKHVGVLKNVKFRVLCPD